MYLSILWIVARRGITSTGVQADYGMLGHGIHIHIPVCVLNFIHTICPRTDCSYAGRYETGDDNRIEDADEGYDEDAVIELGPCEKVKICVLFKNSHYLMEHVHQNVAN